MCELIEGKKGTRLANVIDLLDEEVISAPVIQSHIPGGSGIITGNFTVEESTQLAVLLRAGALPAGLTFLEERTIGPELGADREGPRALGARAGARLADQVAIEPRAQPRAAARAGPRAHLLKGYEQVRVRARV